MRQLTAFVVLSLVGAQLVAGFSGGAPPDTCEAMVPKHRGTAPQNGQPPYTITTNHLNTQEGKVRVILASQGGLAQGFLGFLVQTRKPDSTEALGTFTEVPSEAKAINCGTGQNNAVTHNSGVNKQSVELEWESPPDLEGDVHFVATVVNNYTTYWKDLKSETVRVVKRVTNSGSAGISTTKAPATVTVQDMEASELELYSGCGSSKSCVLWPKDCELTADCKAALAVTKASGGGYTLDLFGKEVKYVAIGFSEDSVMGGDNVIECVHEDNDAENGVKAYRSWNMPGVKRNQREERQSGFSLIRGAYVDDILYCRVHHDANVKVQGKEFNLDKTPYNLLLAAGKNLKPNNVGYHSIFVSSPDKQLMSDYRVVLPEDPFYDGCNDVKTCFGAPDNCVATRNCDAVVAVHVQGEKYQFDMKATKSAAYVAVGLSQDRFMGSDSVIECVYDAENPGRVQAFMSWNVPLPKKGNIRPTDQDGLNLLKSTYTDGTIYCQVVRDIETVVEGTTFNLANDKYYLLLAAGSSLKAESTVGYHNLVYTASGQQISLSDVRSITEASKLLLRLHGAFMVSAWIGVASLGLVLARYYRQTWVTSSLCGKDVWFAWHQLLMLVVWLLTVAGSVLIVVEVGGWVSEASTAHALLGSVTTLLCFIQPFMALFRPHPGASKRPLFNWMHWLVGNAAHILAIITIFLAVQLNKAELPELMDWVLVGYVAFYVLVHLILSFCGCVGDSSSRTRINSFPMKDISTGRAMNMDRKQDAPHAGFRKCLLTILILVVAAITAFLVLMVVFAPFERRWKEFPEFLRSM